MKHDVQIEIRGSMPEKLLEKALAAGAVFTRVQRPEEQRLVLSTDGRSASITAGLCSRYGLEHRILRRSGTPAMCTRLRRRWTLLPAILLCLLICSLFLSRLWLVDVVFAGEPGSEQPIHRLLEESGVHRGMPLKELDTFLLQKQLTARAGGYSFIGVRLQGIRLLVELQCELAAPELYEMESARNICAARSGVVEEIIVYSGQACVKPGDTVLAGDMLIRGRENIGKDSESGEAVTRPVGALGRVIARCWIAGSAEAPLENDVLRQSGKVRNGLRMRLLNAELTLIPCESFPEEIRTEQVLPVVGMFLPLELHFTEHRELLRSRVQADYDQLKGKLEAAAIADARRQLARESAEYETASFWTDESISDNTLHVRAVYEIHTDIAAPGDAPT